MLNLDEERKEAYRSFLTAHARVTQAIDAELTKAGLLPLSWYDVLVTLEYADGHQLRMSELADAVLLSRSGLTRLIDRLEQKGLVERKLCPMDRRGFHARLTDEGRKAREESWPLHSSLIAEFFGSQMSDGDVKAMTTVCQRCIAAVKQFNDREL